MKIHKIILVLGLLLAAQSSVQATLLSRANGTMVYDTDRNLTWVADGNLFLSLSKQYAAGATAYVQSIITANNGVVYDTPNAIDGRDGIYNLSVSNFDTATGQMNWFAAQAWVNSLDYGGYNDWYLPITNPTINGYGNYGSDFQHLYYSELGKTAYALGRENWGIFSNGFAGLLQTSNVGPFNNVVAGTYWSSTEVGSYPYQAWNFTIGLGHQGYSGTNKNSRFYAWAVRNGDVASVPILPSSIFMFSGFIVFFSSSVARWRNSVSRA